MDENYIPPAPAYECALSILGVRVNCVSVADVHRFIERVIEGHERALILHLNVHCVNLCLKHHWLKNFINQAQMVFCDGDGVRWGARILGRDVPPKITYDRWIWQLCEFAQRKGFRLYFLGGKPGVATAAAAKIRERLPNVKIVGAHHGYFDKAGDENELVIAGINQASPDIVILGFGMPIQERWLQNNWERIFAHIFLTGGAVFDYASGNAKRAPAWMIRFQLEWLHRFLSDPQRLLVRYVWGNPLFIFKVFQEKLTLRRAPK